MMRCDNCGREIRLATKEEIQSRMDYKGVEFTEYVHTTEAGPMIDLAFCTGGTLDEDSRVASISKQSIAKKFL